MVAAQLEVGVAHALIRIRAHAFGQGLLPMMPPKQGHDIGLGEAGDSLALVAKLENRR